MTDGLLTEYWLTALAAYRQIMVGLSGGLDSTVLLHLLAREPALIGKLQAVHVHHGLSVNADDWLLHCQQFCDNLSVPLIVQKVECDARSNIEEAARILRYQAFSSLINEDDALVLAHHADDQAETLLLQLFRGAGIDGMAAMPAIKVLKKGTLLRPLLQHSRQTLEAYAQQNKLKWVDDESNQNSTFSRNYLRHQVIPLLQEKWPGITGNLARSAMLCQQAKMNLDSLAEIDIEGLSKQGDTLPLSSLRTLGPERMANVLRVWLRHNEVRRPQATTIIRIINEVILARGDATPIVEWGDVSVQRFQQHLQLLKNKKNPPLLSIKWTAFPCPLQLNEDGVLHATPALKGLLVPPESQVDIRFRQGGELFYWHGQTKQLKKLWQQWNIPPWARDQIPLLYIDNRLAAVVGFAISDHYYSHAPENTYAVDVGGPK